MQDQRSSHGRLLLLLFVLVAVVCLLPRDARADDSTPQAVDYDAADPQRGPLNYARGVANLLFESYVIFQIDWFRRQDWSYVTRGTIEQNVTTEFQFDYDPVSEDLLGHPLHGVLHYTSGRSAGLSFWESAPYAFLGALIWENLGERQLVYPGDWKSKPSTNDFLASSVGGIFLGEALHRISSALLDDTTSGAPRFWHELAGAVVNPMRGFNRLYTGDAFRAGPPPLRLHPIRAAIDIGASRLTSLSQRHGYDPAALLALELEYGTLLPTKHRRMLDPFEFFEAYTAFTLLNSSVGGAQVYGDGLLLGVSTDTTRDTGESRDNDVFGVVTNFDYQGANSIHFGAMSVGLGNFVEWRAGPRKRFRLGTDVDWAYLVGADSELAEPNKGHDFGMGPALGLNLRAELGRWGEIIGRSRHFLAAGLDGQVNQEVLGYTRVSYGVDIVPHVGVGVAPAIIYQRSSADRRNAADTVLELQAYLRVHN